VKDIVEREAEGVHGGEAIEIPEHGLARGKLRDVELGHRWMDALSDDYSCLFPTLMLAVGLHPDPEMEVQLCWAYNRWLTEKALPEGGGRFYSMLTLPLSDPEALRLRRAGRGRR
jgi:hypothetical protein